MRLIAAEVSNFGSYKHITFNFDNKGLCLISGPTGSGKSTLCDIVPWILFGKTAKGGNVDDIISWGSNSTSGSLDLGGIVVYRSRKPNDLYWTIDDTVFRGKDLSDSQNQLNALLGCDLDLYLSAAYFHEFSQTAQFFTTTAKNRRQITDQLADLKLANDLSEETSKYRKELISVKTECEQDLAHNEAKIIHLEESRKSLSASSKIWILRRKDRLVELEAASQSFNEDKAERIRAIKKQHLEKRVELEYDLAELEKEILPIEYFDAAKQELLAKEFDCDDEKCKECGALKDNTKRLSITKDRYNLERKEAENTQKVIQKTRLTNMLNKHLLTLEPAVVQENARTNTYAEQIDRLKSENNPYYTNIRDLVSELKEFSETRSALREDCTSYAVELGDVEILQGVIGDFRGKIVKNTIVELETSTNEILTTYFDGELRVIFDLAEADKLEVTIIKDGNNCVYSQLSKGQRQLLKLSFALSVMKSVKNRHSLNLNSIFLDEFCEGLSEELKIKTYSLLQKLSTEYENVFVVEHSQELKNLFDNRINVVLVDGRSEIAEAP